MISTLLYKYLNNEASEEEVLEVFKWIESSENNKKEFFALKKACLLTDNIALSNTSLHNDFIVLQRKIRRKQYQRLFLRYAAIFLLFFTLGKSVVWEDNAIAKPTNEVVLELETGEITAVSGNESKNVTNKAGNAIAVQQKDEIAYPKSTTTAAVSYHTLKVPYGKTFKVILSDGTSVHLNAGTSLRYPQQFDVKGKRTVFLTGEAFFDVTKDKSRPFIVTTNSVSVAVLGTKFNVSAYPDESSMQTVLTEGSVQLIQNGNANNSTMMSVGQLVNWDLVTNTHQSRSVDVSVYTAWMNGELILKESSFVSICKTIERTFDVRIINSNSNLDKQKFTGTIKLKDAKPQDILNLLQLDTPFKYTVNNRTITITN